MASFFTHQFIQFSQRHRLWYRLVNITHNALEVAGRHMVTVLQYFRQRDNILDLPLYFQTS
ncbi:hypothetical protein, partial [Shigella boydii]|uniref:hypothetical protein n=1 Tax=Shigella boydii TaxID=621 RepID=UPI001C0A8B61